MLLHVSIAHSFILISTVPWNRYSKDWLAACHQKIVGLFPGFGYCEQSCHKYLYRFFLVWEYKTSFL